MDRAAGYLLHHGGVDHALFLDHGLALEDLTDDGDIKMASIATNADLAIGHPGLNQILDLFGLHNDSTALIGKIVSNDTA